MEWKPALQGTYGPNMNAFWGWLSRYVKFEGWSANADDLGDYNSSTVLPTGELKMTISILNQLSHVMRKPVFGAFRSDQVRSKSACSATETSKCNEIVNIETRDIILSRQRTTKALIRLRGCADWSAPLLFPYGIKQVFSWRGSIIASPADLKLKCFVNQSQVV